MRFGAVPLETPVVFSNWVARGAGRGRRAGPRGAIRHGGRAVRLDDVAAYERLAAGDVPRSASWPVAVTLEGKVAAVTGGGSGIGEAICLRLAAEGPASRRSTSTRRAPSGRPPPRRRASRCRRRERQRGGRRCAGPRRARARPGDVCEQRRRVGGAHLERVMPRSRPSTRGGRPARQLRSTRSCASATTIGAGCWRSTSTGRSSARARPRADGAARQRSDREHGLGLRGRGLHRAPALLGRQGRGPRLHARRWPRSSSCRASVSTRSHQATSTPARSRASSTKAGG